MPFAKRSGASSQIDQKLKTKRQKIIEEERIRVLRESLMLFYDKLMEKYILIRSRSDDLESDVDVNVTEDGDVISVIREEVEDFTREYAETKPLGF